MYIPTPTKESVHIDLEKIDLRPDARAHSDEDIAKLAESMAKRQLQSILLCKEGKRYEVIAGVGRVLAARKLEWITIKADVFEGLGEIQKLSIMFDENEDRENPPVLYQARLIQSMIKEDGRTDRTQEETAAIIGKDRTTVSKYMALFKLDPRIWDDVNTFTLLGVSHFMQLLRIKNADAQWKVAKVAAEKDLTAQDLQVLVDKEVGMKSKPKMGRPKTSKTLGEDGFEIKIKKGNLLIRAVLPAAADPQSFLARLGEAVLRLRTPGVLAAEKHPSEPSQPSTIADN